MSCGRWRRFLGLLLPLCCAGCGAVGGLTQAGVQLIHLAAGLASMVLPFVLWYYLYKRND